MKKIIHAFSIILMLTAVFSSAAFAEMKLTGEKDKIVYNPNFPAFEAEIVGADYFYYKGKQMLGVSLYSTKRADANGQPANINVEIIFSNEDIPFGLALASNMGNPATIYFANANLEIEQVNVSKKWDKGTSATLARFTMPQ